MKYSNEVNAAEAEWAKRRVPGDEVREVTVMHWADWVKLAVHSKDVAFLLS